MLVPVLPLTLRQKLLLVFLAGGPEALDPIRIMKGLFIFSMECPADWLSDEARYQFEPYNWGPFSNDVYTDLRTLRVRNYALTSAEPGRSWEYHQASKQGHRVAKQIHESLDARVVEYLLRLRRYTLSSSFQQLLRAVYAKYPEYAVNSVFRH
jgi:hypothetical protein